MNGQQKLWKGMTTFLYASCPCLLYAVLPSVVMLVGQIIRRITMTPEDFMAASGNFYLFVGSLLVLWILRMRSRKRGSTLMKEATLFLEEPDLKFGFRCMLFGVCLAVAFSAFLSVVPLPQWLIGSYAERTSEIFERTDFILSLLVIGVVAPLIEEIVFRGYMINRLLGWYSEKQAILISSIVFGMFHVNLLWVIYAAVMGFLLAAVAVKKDNILYSICLHLGFNLPSLITVTAETLGMGDSFFFQSRLLVAVYGVITACGVYLLYRRYRTEEDI